MHETLIALVMAAHLAWIIFMLSGVALAAAAFFRRELFDLRVFRLTHLLGIIFTAALAALRQPCPLTTLENWLRASAPASDPYTGSFLVRWLEKLVYPDVHPAVIIVPTVLAGLFTVVVYILRPPRRGAGRPDKRRKTIVK